METPRSPLVSTLDAAQITIIVREIQLNFSLLGEQLAQGGQNLSRTRRPIRTGRNRASANAAGSMEDWHFVLVNLKQAARAGCLVQGRVALAISLHSSSSQHCYEYGLG